MELLPTTLTITDDTDYYLVQTITIHTIPTLDLRLRTSKLEHTSHKYSSHNEAQVVLERVRHDFLQIYKSRSEKI
jgi:hypothetical protein